MKKFQTFMNVFHVTYTKTTLTSDQLDLSDNSARFFVASSDDSSSAISNNATQSSCLCKVAHPNWQQLSLTFNEPIQLYM